jgi:Fe-S oxidoreductase
MLNNTMETLENCRFCLMCRHVAPVGLITDLETLTPHGIALIATSQKRGLIDWNDETVGVIYSEPDGGNCRAHCVFDQPHPAAVAAVRVELVEQNLAPTAVYLVNDALEKWGTPFAEEEGGSLSAQGDVALFVGDEARYLWPEALPAVRKLLSALGINPVIIGDGRNNGLLATSLGFPATAAKLAQATLSELQESEATKLLLLSAGDYFTFNQAYEERLGLTWPSTVDLAEVVSLLAEKVDAGSLHFRRSADRTPYAYVDPTHAVRNPQRHEAVRKLVTAVMPTEPHELFYRRENAHPVGSTHLQFSRPELADRLTLARLEDAQNSGAELLICEDPSTLYQLQRHAEAFNLQVRGLYELLAENLLV